jgi:hypothetical protein
VRAQSRIQSACVLPLLLLFVGAAPQDSKAQPKPPKEFELVLLRSGTVIDQGPPQGWTDLILKSSSKLESGDLGTLPASASTTATVLKPVVVANVTRSEGTGPRFRLTRIGMGLCVYHQGRDRVVSSRELGPAGETLGLIERTVLGKAEEEQRKARIIARTPTFAILATPARLKAGPNQKRVYLLYAMLVNPETGKLRSVVWPIDDTPGPRQPTEAMVLLNPSLIFQAGLDVEAGKLLGAIPVSWDFAMTALPPGQKLAIPEGLQALSADPRKIADDPAAFEQDLRAALPKVGSGSGASPITRSSLAVPRTGTSAQPGDLGPR